MTAQEHSKLLAIFFFINAGLQMFGGIFVTLLYGGIGAAFVTTARKDNEQIIGGVIIVFAVVVALVSFALAAIEFFAGWKILKGKTAARTWGIVGSCIALLGFPLGTALGIYGLWFLLGEKGKQFYTNLNAQSSYPPPPPNHWQ